MSEIFENSPLRCFLMIPFWRAQTIIQTQDLIPNLRSRSQMGLFDSLPRIIKEEGFRSLWRSGVPSLLLTLYSVTFRIIMQNREIVVQSSYTQEWSEPEEPKNQDLEGFRNEDPNNRENVHKIHREFVEWKRMNRFGNPGLELAFASMFFGFLIQPFHVLRVRLATDYGAHRGGKYRGMFDCGRKLMRAGGAKALYTGYVPFALHLMINQNVLAYGATQYKGFGYADALWCLSLALTYPLEVIGTRMIMFHDNPAGKYGGRLRECFEGTRRDFGWKGLYRGFQMYFMYFCGGVALSRLTRRGHPY